MSDKWKKVRLDEVLRQHNNSVSVKDLTEVNLAGVYSFGRGLFKRGSMLPNKTSYKAYNRLVTDDFVISIPKAWEGALALVTAEFDGWFLSPVFPTFRTNCDRLLPKFLEWYCKRKSVWGELQHKSRGIGARRESVHPEQFLSLEIPLPPLAEQRRMVARIEELAAQIHEARTLRKQAAEEAEALFDAVLNERFDSSGWPEKLLPEVAEVARGKFAHRPRNEPRFYSGNYPFIQIGDISNSGRYIHNYSQSLNKDGLAISRMFPAGTIAIAITGATIGVTGILGFDSCFPDSIVGIQAKPEWTTPEFIYLAVEHAKKSALAEATQTTQPNINLGNLQRLKVRVPPLVEQRRMVAELDSLQAQVDALKRLQTETASELDALLPSILDKAFKGEL